MSKLANLKPITTWFNTKIPSTGLKIRFRGYNVGDERSLLMAEESGNKDTMITTVDQIVHSCTESMEKGKKIEGFTTYDLEYLYTKIRSKSVGEQSRLVMECSNDECKEKNVVLVDLDTVYVDKKSEPLIIKITPTRGLKVTHPTVIEAAVIDKIEMEWDTQIAALLFSIREVYDGDMVIDFESEERDDKINFISDLPVDVRDKILDYVFSPPEAAIDLKCKCKKCGTETNKTLKGIANFF